MQSVDANSHYPYGYRVPWTNLHTLFYATLVRIVGSPSQQLDVLARQVSWVPPALGVGAMLLAVAITRRVTTTWLCVLVVAALCAISAEVTRPFLYGIIDHHLFAHLGVLLLVVARLTERRSWWVIGLISLIAMTPEAIIFVSVLLACVFLADAAGVTFGKSPAIVRAWFWYVSPAAVALLAWLGHRSVDSEPLPLSELAWMHLSLFHVLWFTLLGVGLRAVLAAERAHRRVPDRFGVAVLLGTVGAFATLSLFFLQWSGSLAMIAQRLLIPQRIFVGEEAFVFQAGFWRVPAWYRVLAFSAVVPTFKLIDGIRRREGADYFFLWIVLLVALLLGFKEFRHLYVLSSLQLIGLGLALFEIERALRGLDMFSKPATRLLPALMLAGATAPFLFLNEIPNRAALGEVCDGLPVIEELTRWLSEHTPSPAPPEPQRAPYSVFNPWSVGHHIHVLAHQPVVVDPFNYDLEGRFDDAIEAAWWSRTADDLMDALEQRGVRYVVLTNPAEEIIGIVRKRHVNKDQFVKVLPDGAVTFLPAMLQFAAFRLFMTDGSSGEFGRLQPRFFTSEAETYTTGTDSSSGTGHVIVPNGQIYEVKAGAVINGVVGPAEHEVSVHYRLQLREQPAIERTVRIPAASDGRFEFRTALPAPIQDTSFRVREGYRFVAGGREAVVNVSQEQVDAGARVELRWSSQPE